MSINPNTAPGYIPASSAQPATPPPPAPVPAPSRSSGAITGILFGAIIVLLAGVIYLFVQVNNLRTDFGKDHDAVMAELDKLREASTLSTQTSRRTVEALRNQLEAARRQAAMAAGQAKLDALKQVDATKRELQQAQELAEQQTKAQISQVQQAADTANTKIGEVGADVNNVKTDVASTKSQLEKTVADLKRVSGDVDGHSTLIATNGKELAALRALGERNFIEFDIRRTKQPQKVGDVTVLLKKADPKHNRYTIELTADDKTVEKKDRTLDEPLQFMTSKAKQPYEIVVNNVKKDEIVGYLSVPKVLNARD